MNAAMKIAHPLAVAACAALLVTGSLPASAQWIWKDEAGHTVASDQPPPSGTPESRIVKSPKTRAPDLVAAPARPADATEAQKTDAQKSAADRELDFKQRQKEAAEAAKVAEQEGTKARALAENCSTVKGNLAGLQAGGRAARVNERGERTYLDDNQRQAEIARAQGQIAQYCK